MRAEVVIIGAGIAGVSAAYELTRRGVRDVIIVDPRPPLSLTSDKSTECYRNFWPGFDGAMAALMNRSIELFEQLDARPDNCIRMNRRGYLYVTRRSERVEEWISAGRQASEYGCGDVRIHRQPDGYPADAEDGIDILYDAQRHFPYLPAGACAMHVRKAGWLKSDQLGRHYLERAQEMGARLIRGEVLAIETRGGAIAGVTLRGKDGDSSIRCDAIVNAAGPMCAEVAAMAGVSLPVFSELHLKLNFRDALGAMPREAPLVICDDPVELPWTDDERAALSTEPETERLTRPLPAGVHGRPEGEGDSNAALLLWTYDTTPVRPHWPIEPTPFLAETVVLGMASVLPAFKGYASGFPKPVLDGGYYTKTRENRPLIGPTSVRGFYLNCAFSGYGIMASGGAAELLAAHVLNEPLPKYAGAFTMDRYDRPEYVRLLESWEDQSQL